MKVHTPTRHGNWIVNKDGELIDADLLVAPAPAKTVAPEAAVEHSVPLASTATLPPQHLPRARKRSKLKR